MYSIASQRTEAVSVFPYGETSCCRATIRSPSFSFLSLADKSALCRLDAREVRLLCSTEQGLLLCSVVIFPTSIPSSPENFESALQKELTIISSFVRQTLQNPLQKSTNNTRNSSQSPMNNGLCWRFYFDRPVPFREEKKNYSYFFLRVSFCECILCISLDFC